MKSTTHFLSAAAISPVIVSATPLFGGEAMVAAVGFVAAAKSPDWLEVARWGFGRRWSVLPHRTITHTWWVWLLAWGAAWFWLSPRHALFAFVTGFCAGALWHILADAMTPMGVPVFNPFGRRRRLRVPVVGSDVGFAAASLVIGAAPFLLMR
jgi:inner membrane protein